MAMAREFVGQEYAVATQGKGLRETSVGKKIATRLTFILSALSVSLTALGMLFCCFFFLSPINGTSMMRSLNATGDNTDSVLTYRFGTPQRGDIIITKLYLHETGDNQDSELNLTVRYPQKDRRGHYMYIIKRLIAVAGDQITIKREPRPDVTQAQQDTDYNYYLYLNGEKLEEPYLDPEVAHHTAVNFIQMWHVLNDPHPNQPKQLYLVDWRATDYDACVQDGVLTIPDGYWFYLGDNRGGNPTVYHYSWDCSYLGPQNAAYRMGICAEIINEKITLPEFLWRKVVYCLSLGWLWPK